MEGAPSAVDLFDPKPELDKSDGKKIEIDVFNGNPGPLMKSPFKFQQYGECGAVGLREVHRTSRSTSTTSPSSSRCYSRSRTTTCRPCTRSTRASPRPGFPSAGAWITYGLGSENQNLPGFVVLGNTQGVKGGPLNWSAGFLPSALPGDALPLGRQPDPQPQAARRT